MWEQAGSDPDPFLHTPAHGRDEAFVGMQGHRAAGLHGVVCPPPTVVPPREKSPRDGDGAARGTLGPELGLGTLPQDSSVCRESSREADRKVGPGSVWKEGLSGIPPT